MEEYLNVLLQQIRSKKARPAIEEELRNHINDQAEAFEAQGQDKAQALEAAIKEMGDPVETGISLDAIHRPAPAWEMIGLMAFLSVLAIALHCVIGLDNGEFGASYIISNIVTRLIGFGIMILVYYLDYSILAKYAKPAAALFLAAAFLIQLFGSVVNGASMFLSIGSVNISLSFYMMLYIPLFAALLYQYHGSGGMGVMKSVIWMALPCYLIFRIPNAFMALELFFVMGLMLTIAVWKNWFHIKRGVFTAVFWGVTLAVPSIAAVLALKFHWLAAYQEARIQMLLSGEAQELSYMGVSIGQILENSHFWGGGHVNLADMLPAYNQDYILLFLVSYYGIFITIAALALLAFIVKKMFSVSIRQKNQLGMMMGCGCALFFTCTILINLLEICGRLPITTTWIPFFSSGFSCQAVSYVMIGIIMSIYRYKDVLSAMPKRFRFMKLDFHIRKE